MPIPLWRRIRHKRKIAYSSLTALLTTLFITLIFAAQRLLRPNYELDSLWLGFTATFILVLIFQPLRDLVQKWLDNIFIGQRYQYQHIINRYSHALTRPMADLNRFAKLAPYLLWKTMKLSGVAVMVLDRESGRYVVRAAIGENEPLEESRFSLPADSLLIQELQSGRREIYRKELFCRLGNKQLPLEEQKKLEQICQELEMLGAELIIPSISESSYFQRPTLLATINLGKKSSGASFSGEDIEFLETLANQAAISVEYAFIFEELKRNQEAMVKNEKLAALGQSCAGIAHELKNPLTYLRTVAQAMSDNWEKPAFKENVLNMLPSEIERMKFIIDGLSDYSRGHELRLEKVEVATIIDKALAVLGYEIKKHNVTVKKEYPADGKVTALGDKDQLIQVFINIIANAVQAMGEKGGELKVSVAPGVIITISDTGPGIPPEKLQRIFDPFFTTKESGTGLGLSITKKIVEAHQGEIKVDSQVGQGTTFTIKLPAA